MMGSPDPPKSPLIKRDYEKNLLMFPFIKGARGIGLMLPTDLERLCDRS